MKIINKAKVFAMAGILALAGAVAVLPRGSVYAGIGDGASTAAQGELAEHADLTSVVQSVINIILYVVGVVAVIMMIFGGFQYITSSGDAAKVTKAKNTILYGVVGLVIAVLAYAIVNFVLGSLSGNTNSNPSMTRVENYETKELLEYVK